MSVSDPGQAGKTTDVVFCGACPWATVPGVSGDGRIERILNRIMTMAAGDLATRLPVSDEQDDVDAIIVGLNLLAEELEFSLKERRMLRGLLPICSFCKKIRDHGGQWTHLEEYIQDRSEARFSHGYCRECVQEHFGDIPEED